MVEWQRTAGVILLLLTAGVGCENSSPAKPATTVVRLAHSNSAPQLGEIISRLPNVSAEEIALQSGGSIAVLAALQKGAIDIGAATADVSYLSLVGRLGAEPPFKELRAIAVAWIERRPFVCAGRSVVEGDVTFRSAWPEGQLGCSEYGDGPDCSTVPESGWSRTRRYSRRVRAIFVCPQAACRWHNGRDVRGF